MVYMVAAIVVSLSPVGAAGLLSVETYRPSARLLAALMATGVAVVWPMVRLSQIRPRHPARAISQDLVIVMVPIAAMCAAQAAPWMAGWPWPVGLALAMGLLAWSLLIGGIILHAFASEAARHPAPAPAATQGHSQPLDPDSGVDQPPVVGVRVLAMLVLMALAAVGPVVAAIAYTPWHSVRGEPGLAIDWAMMSSPVGFALEVARDRVWTGWSAAIGVRHWLGVAVIGVLGVLVLASARARVRRI